MVQIAGYLDFTNVANALRAGASNDLTRALSKDTEKFLKRLEKAVENNAVDTKKLMLVANERLAQNMRSSVLHSYDQVVTARKKVPSYRAGEDRFAGKLRTALENSVNYRATPTGIRFIDLDFMDEAAAHWYRLNFGAAPAAGRQAYEFNLILDGDSLGQIGLSNWAPSKPFRLPAGFFTEAGEFYPYKIARNHTDLTPSARIGRGTLTHGIAARRFLDAGMDRLSRDFNHIYGDVVRQVQNQRLDRLKSI